MRGHRFLEVSARGRTGIYNVKGAVGDMKTTKKFLALALSVLMLFAQVSLYASAQDTTEESTTTYRLEPTTLDVGKIWTNFTRKPVIPTKMMTVSVIPAKRICQFLRKLQTKKK